MDSARQADQIANGAAAPSLFGPLSERRPEQGDFRNRLLLALSPMSLERIRPHLERVRIKPRQILMESGLPMLSAYFIEDGAASVVSRGPGEPPLELSIIGRFGFVGLPIILGANRSPYRCIVQLGGSAWRIEAEKLHHAYEHDRNLRRVLNCHVQARLVQQAQITHCNCRHNVEQRICRWLLMAQDRIDGATVPATHDLISRMLGVRRAGVTIALGKFEELGIVRRARGRVEILDRDGLENRACSCHRLIRLEYERLLDCAGAGSRARIAASGS